MKLKWIPVALLGLVSAPFAVDVATATETVIDQPKPADEVKPKVLKIGSAVPEALALPDFQGNLTNFKDLRGKVAIVHFWSDRCPAERHANPVFKKMEAHYADSKDVVMIGIASNQNELGKAPEKDADFSAHYTSLRKKVKEVGYKHTILADHGNVVSSLFGARSTPHCFVIDKEGVVRYSGALDDDPRGKKGEEATNYLMEAASAILAGTKLPVTETKPYG